MLRALLALRLGWVFSFLLQQRDLLAVLSGGFPNQDLPENFELSSLQLPQGIPLSLPSQLVEQRPDVRQAEENLHSASAQIGIARANRFPNFALTADAGSMTLAFARIFTSGTGYWDLGAGVTQPIFQGGTLLHRERAARAAYTQASEQYRSTVLTAYTLSPSSMPNGARVNIVPIKTDRQIFSFSFGSRLLLTRSGISGATLLSRLPSQSSNAKFFSRSSSRV